MKGILLSLDEGRPLILTGVVLHIGQCLLGPLPLLLQGSHVLSVIRHLLPNLFHLLLQLVILGPGVFRQRKTCSRTSCKVRKAVSNS